MEDSTTHLKSILSMTSFLRPRMARFIEDAVVKLAICDVLDSRSYHSWSGYPQVKAFERALSTHMDRAYIIGLNSGTDALVIALKVLGIGPGDEVIVPAFSFIATVSPVSWVGATPVFVDITSDDYALDPSKIEEKISSKTKAIIIAHLFGQPARRMDKIIELAKRHSLFLIEDAAQSFGARVLINGKQKLVGTLGDAGSFSFSSTKPLTAPGNAGVLVMRDHNYREEAERMCFYGARQHYYDYPTVGINVKMHEIHAAALLARIPFINYWLEHRKKLALQYTDSLAGVGDLVLPKEYPETTSIWYRYVIRTRRRDALFDHLKELAGSLSHLRPMKNYPVPFPYFSVFTRLGYKPGSFPVSEQVSSEVLSLPITQFVSPKDVMRITQSIRTFFSH